LGPVKYENGEAKKSLSYAIVAGTKKKQKVKADFSFDGLPQWLADHNVCSL
jgi:hypothetical protein